LTICSTVNLKSAVIAGHEREFMDHGGGGSEGIHDADRPACGFAIRYQLAPAIGYARIDRKQAGPLSNDRCS
jgi:hypothetical protein